MEFRYTVEELLAAIPNSRHAGSPGVSVSRLASLSDAGPDSLSFLSSAKHRADLATSQAGIVLVPETLPDTPREGQAFLHVRDPSLALADLCAVLEARWRPAPPVGVHPTAVVAATAQVHPSASIGPLCVIGEGATIGASSVLESQVHIGRGARVGEGCYLFPRTTVQDYCVLGRNVRIHAGTVIGSDGFGYLQVGGEPPNLRHKKVPQVGIVVVEDDVEIGANATIDRARFGETRIGEGTKLDNLVHIAHNVHIGRHCIICAQVGIAGSTTIGDYVVMWGQVGVAGHLEVGTGAFIGAQAGIAKSVPPGGKVTGTPARPLLTQRRQEAALAHLPDLLRDLRANGVLKRESD